MPITPSAIPTPNPIFAPELSPEEPEVALFVADDVDEEVWDTAVFVGAVVDAVPVEVIEEDRVVTASAKM
jgi:hypothetical protein